MSRLQKKCFLASLGLHGLLALVFLFGSAFFAPDKKQNEARVLNVVPSALFFDRPSSGGGNPNIAPTNEKQKGNPLAPPLVAPPAPTPPAPEPPVVKPQSQAKKPDPKPEPVKPEPIKDTPKPKTVKDSPKDLVKDVVKPPPKTEPKNDFVRIDPKKPKPEPPKPVEPSKEFARAIRTEEELRREREAVERRRQAEESRRLADEARREALENERIASQIGGVLDRLNERRGFAEGTRVEVSGPGGEAYANYLDYLRTIYDDAWLGWRTLTDSDAVALVRVTVARSGHVTEARLIQRSRNGPMDRSVQDALNKVKFIAPFPPGTTETQKSFTIEFNLKAKRGTG